MWRVKVWVPKFKNHTCCSVAEVWNATITEMRMEIRLDLWVYRLFWARRRCTMSCVPKGYWLLTPLSIWFWWSSQSPTGTYAHAEFRFQLKNKSLQTSWQYFCSTFKKKIVCLTESCKIFGKMICKWRSQNTEGEVKIQLMLLEIEILNFWGKYGSNC